MARTQAAVSREEATRQFKKKMNAQSKEEFGRRALAGGNMWHSLSRLMTLLESFDKNNPEMGIDSVTRQMHQKTVQHYWVNIVKQ